MSAKDQEMHYLHNEITSYRKEYENIMEVKLALDMEIGIYRKLIEAEESRLRRWGIYFGIHTNLCFLGLGLGRRDCFNFLNVFLQISNAQIVSKVILWHRGM